MANLFSENKVTWKALADIDYFGAFVKAYLPFNAWMNCFCGTLNSDREKINEIKKNPNTFRNKIYALLDSDSQEGSNFRNQLGELHGLLEHNHIYNQDNRITFTSVITGRNTLNVSEDLRRGIGFRVQYGNGTATNTHSLIKHRDGSSIFSLMQSDYNVDELKRNVKFNNLQGEYQTILLNCYKNVEPLIHKNCICVPDDSCPFYQCGNYRFVKETESLAKGLIEIIYNLRCSLFHGEIVPNKDANQVYGAAYRILYTLIQSL